MAKVGVEISLASGHRDLVQDLQILLLQLLETHVLVDSCRCCRFGAPLRYFCRLPVDTHGLLKKNKAMHTIDLTVVAQENRLGSGLFLLSQLLDYRK